MLGPRVLRNVRRIVQDELLRAVPNYFERRQWFPLLDVFVPEFTRWHSSYICNVSNTKRLECAIGTFLTLNDTQLYMRSGWGAFSAALDKMHLIGCGGAILQTLGIFVHIWNLCTSLQISPLGIRYLLTTSVTNEKVPQRVSFGEFTQLVKNSTDSRQVLAQRDILQVTHVFWDLFELGTTAQIEMILDIIWSYQLQHGFTRADVIITHDPDVISVTRTPEKKQRDFLVFLEPTFTLICVPPGFVQVYKQRLVSAEEYLNVFWICFLYSAMKCLWYNYTRTTLRMRMKIACCKVMLVHYIQKTIQSCRFRNVVNIRVAVQNWMNTTKLDMRRTTRKQHKKQKKFYMRQNQRAIITPIVNIWCKWVRQSQVVKNLRKNAMFMQGLRNYVTPKRIHVSIVKSWCKWTRQTYLLRRAKQNIDFCNAVQARVYKNRQARKMLYMSTPDGVYCMAHLRMTRSLLKQLLRIVTKCLSFFIDTDDAMTLEFREYLETFTFSIEPFHFHLLRCSHFNETPRADILLSFTQQMASKTGFYKNFSKYINTTTKLQPFNGCLPVFRYACTLFTEFNTCLVCVPDKMLKSCFIPFTLKGVNKAWYTSFCVKYTDLCHVWCIEQNILQDMVSGWLETGGRNFDLLDMLTKLQQACMDLEKKQGTATKKLDFKLLKRQ